MATTQNDHFRTCLAYRDTELDIAREASRNRDIALARLMQNKEFMQNSTKANVANGRYECTCVNFD